jgi:glycerol-3-phosphate acyltransferase PlsX
LYKCAKSIADKKAKGIENMSKIVVDVYGGDNAPDEIMTGVTDALKMDGGLKLVLAGKKDVIRDKLVLGGIDPARVEIVDANDVVTNYDAPATALRAKPDSSLAKAFQYLKANDDAKVLVSAGSTGAVLAGATLNIGRVRGVIRPALAPLLPTLVQGKKTLMLDIGANADSRPEYLAQFALMGSIFMKTVFGIESPKIALLSNGAEDSKGSELHIEANKLLRASGLNFVGNVEGRDLMNGEQDVIVSDGFSGNVALKAMEGTSEMMFRALKDSIKGFRATLGALMLKSSLKKMKNEMDYTKIGGAQFLGCKKLVIKCHGSAKAVTIAAAMKQAKTLAESDVVSAFEREFEKILMENGN